MNAQTTAHINELLVSPNYCIDLMRAKVTRETIYQYRRYGSSNIFHVVCPALDPMNIAGTEDFLQHVCSDAGIEPSYKDFPAYTLTDIIKAIPGISMNAYADGYEVSSKIKAGLFVKDNRLPDAAARFLLYMIDEGLLSTNNINTVILKTTY